VTAALADDDVIEIMVNPNGELFLDRLSRGVVRTGVVVPDSQVELTIGTVASLHDLVVTPSSPLLKVELPLGGERFQGMLRPVSPRPT
jgi:Flp pilus assembly CpaF family ATPase